ncbi:MAG: hypothetical protein ACOWYE_04655, partial [Desulfatiglandales bacterium]
MGKIRIVNLVFITPLLDKMEEMTKGSFNRTVLISIAAWLAMMAVLISCDSGPPQPTQAPSSAKAPQAETPALNGARLLETRCSACHNANRPRQVKKTREQWEQTVTRMIGKGAQLTEIEKTVLLEYLAKTYFDFVTLISRGDIRVWIL